MKFSSFQRRNDSHKKDTGKEGEDARRQHSHSCDDRQIPSDLGKHLNNRDLAASPPSIAENVEGDPQREIWVCPSDRRNEGVGCR